MKSSTRIVTTIGIALFIGCASARAEGWTDNLYLNADLGSAVTSGGTTHFRQFSQGVILQGTGQFQADPGIRGDLSIGYQLTKCLAVEVEGGVIWYSGPGSENNYYEIPAMLKARYQVPLNNSWKIDVGAGAGGVVINEESEFSNAAFHTPFRFDNTYSSFGYEADAGIKYTPSRHIEIGLGYKFLGVSGYDYRFDAGDFALAGSVRDLYTHTAMLSFTWKF